MIRVIGTAVASVASVLWMAFVAIGQECRGKGALCVIELPEHGLLLGEQAAQGLVFRRDRQAAGDRNLHEIADDLVRTITAFPALKCGITESSLRLVWNGRDLSTLRNAKVPSADTLRFVEAVQRAPEGATLKS